MHVTVLPADAVVLTVAREAVDALSNVEGEYFLEVKLSETPAFM